MKKRLITAVATGVLMAMMLPGATSALIVDGRPGQYELVGILIEGDLCQAFYADPVAGNIVISNGGDGPVDIRVVENKNRVKVICTFLDTSGVYEANAEVGTGNCTYYQSPFPQPPLSGGTGRVTAAANNAKDGSHGGNVTLQCTFEL